MTNTTLNENKYHTIVGGGGIAGLTAATYLAHSGKKVLLVEKNKEPGGLVNSFVHNGFHFDAGVRALEDAGIIFPMLNELGIELEVVKSPVSVGIEDRIIHINTIADLQTYQQLLNDLFPQNKDEIETLTQIIGKIIKQMDVLYGIENPMFKDIMRNLPYLFRTLLPWLPRFLLTVGKINRMNKPVEEFLYTIITNPSLSDMISQHFFKHTPTFFALSYFSLYLDYFYPKGGVGKLSEALQHKLLQSGGEIRTETQITQVHADRHTIVDQQGTPHHYQHLIWAADLKYLYQNLQTHQFAPKTKVKIEQTKATLLTKRGTDSVFSLFLEIDEPLESFRKITNGHLFYTPSKQGLGTTHRTDLDQLLDNFDQLGKEEILLWLDKFVSLNTFEISIPGLKDPQLTPAGKTGMTVSLLAEYTLFAKIKAAHWIDQFTQEIETRIVQTLSTTLFSMLTGKIIHRFSFSPLSIAHRIGSSEGAIVGWQFQKKMPVINKIQLAGRSVQTPIPDVYQIGQWAYSPAGVPMSILTAKIASDRILKKK